MKKIFLIVLSVFSIHFSMTAQSKIGVINTTELLPLMPEYKIAEKELETYQLQQKTLLEKKYTDYRTIGSQFMEQVQKGILSPNDQKMKQEELAKMEEEIGAMEQQVQAEVAKKQEELLGPMQRKALDAIQAVAKANGYTHVIDNSVGIVLFFPEADNLLPMVKTHIGIQ